MRDLHSGPANDLVAKYQVFRSPTVIDFLTVCHRLPADEIEQFEAFAGEPYDPDRVAAIYSLKGGPAWVMTADDKPIAIAGFDQVRPGVWQDWMFSTPEAWSDHWRALTRQCRKGMDAMLRTEAHRLQCVSLATRTRAHRWYGVLGLEQEGPLRRYGAAGQDAIMFSRVRAE